jgi:Tol biopolymer transport system component
MSVNSGLDFIPRWGKLEMDGAAESGQSGTLGDLNGSRLESWGEIAAYLKRDVRTVQRWESVEGLPVHRHQHKDRGTVYAFTREIDRWSEQRSFRPDHRPRAPTAQSNRTKIPLQPEGKTGERASPPEKHLRWYFLLTAVAVFVVAAGIVWRVKPGTSALAVEKRITANPAEAPIRAAVISPDGKYISYADPTGLYVRQVDTGEIRRLALPKEFNPEPSSWFPDSTDLIVQWSEGKEQASSIWRLSILGGSPQRLMDDAFGAAVSPDGSHITFLRGHDLWTMESNGANARRIVSADEGLDPAYVGSEFWPVVWSPTGKRIAYIQHYLRSAPSPGGTIHSLWTRDPTGGDPQLVMTGPGLGGALCWAANGRLIYSFHEGESDRKPQRDVWAIQVDPYTGKPHGGPQRLSQGLGWIGGLSITAAGNRVVFLRGNSQEQVFIGEFDKLTRRLSPPFRLTLDENGNLPTAWTPDSKSVLFVSDRNGTWKMFKQPIDQATAELVVDGRSRIFLPRLSPDGSAVFYMEGYRPDNPSIPVSIMRMNLSGGAPQEVLRQTAIFAFQCARIPSRLCLFNTQVGSTTTFFSFDPERGKGAEVARMTGTGQGVSWSLSPDGSLLAIIKHGEHEDAIRYLSLPSGVVRDVVVKDWPRLFNADWSADGEGLLIPSATSNWGTPVLLFVDVKGRARVLWEGKKNAPLNWVIPSPDGRHLALMQDVGENNVWMIENF